MKIFECFEYVDVTNPSDLERAKHVLRLAFERASNKYGVRFGEVEVGRTKIRGETALYGKAQVVQ